MKVFRLFLFLSIMLFLSCSSIQIDESSFQRLYPHEKEKAQIVFYKSFLISPNRPYSLGEMYLRADIFDVTNQNLKYIGPVGYNYIIIYNCDPGDKIFMLYSMAFRTADFMKIDLKKEETYFCKIARLSSETKPFIFIVSDPGFPIQISDDITVIRDLGFVDKYFKDRALFFEAEYGKHWRNWIKK